jgi:hypothetical protein
MWKKKQPDGDNCLSNDRRIKKLTETELGNGSRNKLNERNNISKAAYRK